MRPATSVRDARGWTRDAIRSPDAVALAHSRPSTSPAHPEHSQATIGLKSIIPTGGMTGGSGRSASRSGAMTGRIQRR